MQVDTGNKVIEIGQLVTLKEYKIRPRLRLGFGLRLHSDRLQNTLGLILKVYQPEEVWEDFDNLSKEDKDWSNLPENQGYLWFSQVDSEEFLVFQNEIE